MTEAAAAAPLAPCAFRRLALDDWAFVYSSWMRSYRAAAFAISNPVYYHHQRALIAQLLQRGLCLLVHNPEDAAQLLGFAAAEAVGGVCVLHYLYVKHPFRRLGVARALCLEAARQLHTAGGYQHTHRTAAGKHLADTLPSTFNPYLTGGLHA